MYHIRSYLCYDLVMQARPFVKMLHLFVNQPHPQVLIKIVHLCCVKYSYKWVQTLC